MSWQLFTRIVDQVPNVARVVLHGVGEPMLVTESRGSIVHRIDDRPALDAYLERLQAPDEVRNESRPGRRTDKRAVQQDDRARHCRRPSSGVHAVEEIGVVL